MGPIPSITAFEKNEIGLRIMFSFTDTNDPTLTSMNVTTSNSGARPIEDYVFQAAVPKVSIRRYVLCLL